MAQHGSNHADSSPPGWGQEKWTLPLLLGPVSLQQPLPAESRPPAGGAEPNSLRSLVFTCICSTRSTWLTIKRLPQCHRLPLPLYLYLSSHWLTLTS